MGRPGYYTRFGFINVPGLSVEQVPTEVFFTLSFDARFSQGIVTFDEAFMATGKEEGTMKKENPPS